MINQNFLKLQSSYLFSDIAKKVKAFRAENPDMSVISLGIGDVTQPLPQACIQAMHKAVDEMGSSDTFRGYGPEQGYEFLRQAIISNDYQPRGVQLDLDEVFISDGAKSDCGNIGDILDTKCSVGVTDPVYPVYVDSNVMSGRAGCLDEDKKWSNITFFPVSAGNQFVPPLPQKHVDIIYLCYPNNPTGTVLDKDQLKEWVEYALREQSLIIFDSAYEAYIQHDDIPHSIYEIDGAKQCAIELRSYSKTAGFTGVRCGYTVVPKDLRIPHPTNKNEHPILLNSLWNRRQCTKFNGTSYITQRGAEAIYTPQGKEEIRNTVGYYMNNARYMREALVAQGYKVFGGTDAPYIWLQTPAGTTSWEFFDMLLYNLGLVTTPGVGFGPSGEGYVRLTAFGKKEDCVEAMNRFSKLAR
ncbi:MAG: LL-diaminopimelate aminotransferase [Bacteroidaceae bacterium]|nr:LL-diaminopimelate aminotransferase [Bacteroidales bacterium]MCF0203237.1 LL-diaminopimelate aminotransferase [Bacteroidaceae bacterium]